MLIIPEGNIVDSDANVIAHQVNCMGVMNARVAKRIRDRWPDVYNQYHALCQEYKKAPHALLGNVQLVPIENGRYIFNIFGQLDSERATTQTEFNALERGLIDTIHTMEQMWPKSRLALPWKIGCGLAGWNWEAVVYPMIQDLANKTNIQVELWKLPEPEGEA